MSGGGYNTRTISSGAHESFNLGNGEAFSNELIDISASGAKATIEAHASDWSIQNVGWTGVWDDTANEYFIRTTADGSCTIDNIYIGDGSSSTAYKNGPNGMYVANASSGTIDINNINVQHVADNAVYGSNPGDSSAHPSGQGGGATVNIYNSYAADLEPSAFRVGTSGSTVENCVAVNTHRGGWAYYENPTYIGCDFSNCQIADYYGGNGGAWSKTGTMTVQDCAGGTTTGNIDGSLVGGARRTSPEEVEGVPLTAEEAASGQGGGAGIPDSSPQNPDSGDSGFGASTIEASTVSDTSASLRGEVFLDDQDSADYHFEYNEQGSN